MEVLRAPCKGRLAASLSIHSFSPLFFFLFLHTRAQPTIDVCRQSTYICVSSLSTKVKVINSVSVLLYTFGSAWKVICFGRGANRKIEEFHAKETHSHIVSTSTGFARYICYISYIKFVSEQKKRSLGRYIDYWKTNSHYSAVGIQLLILYNFVAFYILQLNNPRALQLDLRK